MLDKSMQICSIKHDLHLLDLLRSNCLDITLIYRRNIAKFNNAGHNTTINSIPTRFHSLCKLSINFLETDGKIVHTIRFSLSNLLRRTYLRLNQPIHKHFLVFPVYYVFMGANPNKRKLLLFATLYCEFLYERYESTPQNIQRTQHWPIKANQTNIFQINHQNYIGSQTKTIGFYVHFLLGLFHSFGHTIKLKQCTQFSFSVNTLFNTIPNKLCNLSET